MVDQAKRASIEKQLTIQLKMNGLQRRPVKPGNRSFFRAVSDFLYFHELHADQLVTLCQNTLEFCFNQKKLPSKLAYLSSKQQTIRDYRDNPHLQGYLKMHLQLLSHALQRRILVYSITQDYYLNFLIIGDRHFTRDITLSKIDNLYNAVVNEHIIEMTNFIKQIINEKIDSALKKLEDDREKAVKQHKKSCDELEFRDIFAQTRLIPEIFKNQSPRVQRMHSLEEEDEELNLINECTNVVSKTNRNDQWIFYPRIPAFMSQRVLSFASAPLIPAPKLTKTQSKQAFDPIKDAETNKRYTGRLKFFDQNKNYGFIVMDEDNTDIFVHYDDLHKAGMTKEYMRTTKQGNIIRFSFTCMNYIGKYDKSRKAVELQVETDEYNHM